MDVHHAALAVSAAIFDSLWQGVLFAAAATGALALLRNAGAATRYAVWLCVLVGIVVIPALTISLRSAPTPSAPTPVRLLLDRVPTTPVVAIDSSAALPLAAQPGAHLSSQPMIRPARPRNANIRVPEGLAAVVAAAWLLVLAWRLVTLAFSVRRLASARRAAQPWRRESAYGYPVVLSEHVDVPLAAGWLRPAVILPAHLPDELSSEGVDAVIRHEVAHLRRYDVWTNALAQVAYALVAFNPVAWFVMRRLATEREIACDDCVVAATGAGSVFAEALARIAMHVRGNAVLAAPSVLGPRHALLVRIEHMLSAYPRRLRLSRAVLGGALGVLAASLIAMRSIAPVFAYELPHSASMGSQHSVGTSCTVANRGVRIKGLTLYVAMRSTKPVWFRPANARAVLARFGSAHAATLRFTVGADGKPQGMTVLSAPAVAGMAGYVKKIFLSQTYEPAVHDCVPVARSIETGIRIGLTYGQSMSIVTPVYPAGWSTRHVGSCKLPSLIHIGTPALPRAMRNIPLGKTYYAAVRVGVNASGSVVQSAITESSGSAILDGALLTAARGQHYPLVQRTGFKPVRPDGASLAWNATHGSAFYAKCAPLPSAYVWKTSFYRKASRGLPGSTGDFLILKEPL